MTRGAVVCGNKKADTRVVEHMVGVKQKMHAKSIPFNSKAKREIFDERRAK